MHEELCICSLIPSLPTETKLVLLMHAQERHKPSNTGRLAHYCLPHSEIRYRGLKEGPPLSYEGLIDDEHETWMLYLSPQSVEISEALAQKKKPVRLLVPDGNWSQASRTGAKISRELPVKCVYLKADVPSEYRLRTEHHPDGMATFEAIARAMGVIEGVAVREEMEKIFRVMVERVLWTRGKLAASEVTGGIPNQISSRKH